MEGSGRRVRIQPDQDADVVVALPKRLARLDRGAGRRRGPKRRERMRRLVHHDRDGVSRGQLRRLRQQHHLRCRLAASRDLHDGQDTRRRPAAALHPRHEALRDRRASRLGQERHQATRVDPGDAGHGPGGDVGADHETQVVAALGRRRAHPVGTARSVDDDDQRRRLGVRVEPLELVRRGQLAWVVADVGELEDRDGVGRGDATLAESRVAGEGGRIGRAGRRATRAERQAGDEQAAEAEQDDDAGGGREQATTGPPPRRQGRDRAAQRLQVLGADAGAPLEQLAEVVVERIGHRRSSAS